MAEIFKLSDEIAEHIAQVLTLEVAQPSRVTPTDPLAIKLYLRARFELRRNWHGKLKQVVELFEQARERAPKDPLILSGEAVARARVAFLGGAMEEPQVQVARLLVRQALEKAPRRCETLYASALVDYVDNRLADAIQALRKALAIGSTYAEAHDLLGRILLEVGPVNEAMSHLQAAITLEPGLLNARWDLVRAHALLGNWAQVDLLFQFRVEHDYDHAIRALYHARFSLWRDDPTELSPAPEFHANKYLKATIETLREARRAHTATAQKEVLRSLSEVLGNKRLYSHILQILAEVCAFAADEEGCFAAIEESLSLGLCDLVWLQLCPLFQPFRQNPRFQQLRGQLKERIEHLRRSKAPPPTASRST